MPVSVSDWTPSDLDSGILSAWFKADSLSLSDGAGVGTWTDSSGNGNTAAQLTSSRQPKFETNELNSKPVLRFDGSDIVTDGDIAALDVGTGDIWMAAVFKSTDTSAEQIIFEKDHQRFSLVVAGNGDLQFRAGGPGGSNNAVQNSGNWSRTAFVIATAARVSGTLSGFVNGSAANTTGVNSTQSISNSNVFDIGGRAAAATGKVTGDIAEILVGGATLTTEDREKIEGYLAHKYGLEGNLNSGHTYKSNSPQVTTFIKNYFFSNLRRKNKSKGMKMKSTIPSLN
tara:strand:+ start:1280 stop:2134 length:855 start_codon:yes stop_codon:yes gene_type:complete